VTARVPIRLVDAAAPQRSPSPAELAAAVLRRSSAEAVAPVGGARPDAAGRAWRGRAADEALLLIELCRWLEGCHRPGGRVRPAPGALVDVFVGLARRRAPLPPVRGFVRGVVRQAHVELAGARARPDAELARRDEDVVLGLLEQCYQEPAEPPAGASGKPERRRAELLLAGEQGGPAAAGEPRRAWLVVVLAEPGPGPDRLPAGALAAVRDDRVHLLVPVEHAGRRAEVWTGVSRWLAEHGGLRAAGAFAEAPGEVPQAAASAARLLALAAPPAGRPAVPPAGTGPADAAPMGGPP
jgi:hypothetical protein